MGRLSPQDASFGEPPIPARFQAFHDTQIEALENIEKAYRNGVKVVFLSAPTGSGKTLVGEATRRAFSDAVYVCTTKTLQDQVLREFDYAATLKGRANYPTLDEPSVTADLCTLSRQSLPACTSCPGDSSKWGDETGREGPHCVWCHPVGQCPYTKAKYSAAAAPLPVLNTAYLLHEVKRRRSVFGGRDLVIIDEADTLEEQVKGHVEVAISPQVRREVGVVTVPKKTVADSWVAWVEGEMLPAVRSAVNRLPEGESTDRREIRRRKRLTSLLEDLRFLVRPIDGQARLGDGWVLSGYEKRGRLEDYTIVFKPVYARDLARTHLWNHGNHFLLMSASFVSIEQTASELGLEPHEWVAVKMPSTFPPERRPVFIERGPSMTWKTMDTAVPKMVEMVRDILRADSDVRILVHCVSYRLANDLYEGLRRYADLAGRLLTYSNAKQRQETLEAFLEHNNGVLLAPSMERGVDLPYEHCQVQIIAKVPYAPMKDPVVETRMRAPGGQAWYARETIRTIVQMTGRGMRSADDWCDTYILDANFRRLLREWRVLFPDWWLEALAEDPHRPKYRYLYEARDKRRADRKGGKS